MSGLSKLFGFLYARPSFAEGVARLVDFGSVLNEYNEFDSPTEADAFAIRADWVTVGDDLWDAAETVAAREPAAKMRSRQLVHAG
jgi:hypothetical protein